MWRRWRWPSAGVAVVDGGVGGWARGRGGGVSGSVAESERERVEKVRGARPNLLSIRT